MELRVKIACLKSYTIGYDQSMWIDLKLGIDLADLEVAGLLKSTGGDETIILETEGFGSYELFEYSTMATIFEVGSFIENTNHGDDILLYCDSDLAEAKKMSLRMVGVYSSLAAYAEETYRSVNLISDELNSYIDWKKVAEEWSISARYEYIEIDSHQFLVFYIEVSNSSVLEKLKDTVLS